MESPLLIAAGGLALIVLLWALVTFNRFVGKRNRARTALSSIDVNLKKRHDLIPNLVGAVKGYMKHEAGALERVTRLRERAMEMPADDPGRAAVEREIGSFLAAINVRVEAYPDLKASDHVMHLQRTLNEIEEQISAARRAYNAAVESFNNAVEMFPSRIIAGLMGLGTMSFFEAVETDRVTPAVDLSGD
jgi:LemA protein